MGMANTEFRWVAETPGDTLVRKLNEEISDMEDAGYQLDEKEILEDSEEGTDNLVVILLQFSKNRFTGDDNDVFVEAVDISIADEDEEGYVDGYKNKQIALSERVAEVQNKLESTYPDHQVMDMELDEKGRTLYLRFEPV